MFGRLGKVLRGGKREVLSLISKDRLTCQEWKSGTGEHNEQKEAQGVPWSAGHLTPHRMNEWRKSCFAWPINFPMILYCIGTVIREFFPGCFPIIVIWRCEKLHSTARKTTPRASISICISSPSAGKYLDSFFPSHSTLVLMLANKTLSKAHQKIKYLPCTLP